MNTSYRSQGRRCICIILGLLVLSWAGSTGAGQVDSIFGDARVLDGVKGFMLDYDSGNMGIRALSSCIGALKVATAYHDLVGLSGSAFKFVYDSTEAYEPLRDLYPIDALQEAAVAQGFVDAHWVVNESTDNVKLLIKKEIDGGRPLIAPFLKRDAYHGFFVIAGYDYRRGVLYLQGALGLDSGYVSVPVPDSWEGPTASPQGWGRNPVFALGEGRTRLKKDGASQREAVREGIRILQGGTLEYGTQTGEQDYISAPGPHAAHYGLPAYDILSGDVEGEPALVNENGVEAVNFGLIWRLDSQLGQLEHDRHHGAAFLKTLAKYLPSDNVMLLGEAVENFEKVVGDVRVLRRMFWHPVPEWCEGPEDVMRYVERETSIVYRVPDGEDMLSGLEAHDLEARPTPWGPVVVLDSAEKRLRAKILVKSIASREKNSLYILEDIVEYIGKVTRVSPRPGGSSRDSGHRGAD